MQWKTYLGPMLFFHMNSLEVGFISIFLKFLTFQRFDQLKIQYEKELGSNSKCSQEHFVNAFCILCYSPGIAGSLIFDKPIDTLLHTFIKHTQDVPKVIQEHISLSHTSKHLLHYCNIFANTERARNFSKYCETPGIILA
jgi:hypothetical protein